MGSGLCKDVAGPGGTGGTEQPPSPQQKPLEQGSAPAPIAQLPTWDLEPQPELGQQ